MRLSSQWPYIDSAYELCQPDCRRLSSAARVHIQLLACVYVCAYKTLVSTKRLARPLEQRRTSGGTAEESAKLLVRQKRQLLSHHGLASTHAAFEIPNRNSEGTTGILSQRRQRPRGPRHRASAFISSAGPVARTVRGHIPRNRHPLHESVPARRISAILPEGHHSPTRSLPRVVAAEYVIGPPHRSDCFDCGLTLGAIVIHSRFRLRSSRRSLGHR